jgi:hypothetical protein
MNIIIILQIHQSIKQLTARLGNEVMCKIEQNKTQHFRVILTSLIV